MLPGFLPGISVTATNMTFHPSIGTVVEPPTNLRGLELATFRSSGDGALRAAAAAVAVAPSPAAAPTPLRARPPPRPARALSPGRAPGAGSARPSVPRLHAPHARTARPTCALNAPSAEAARRHRGARKSRLRARSGGRESSREHSRSSSRRPTSSCSSQASSSRAGCSRASRGSWCPTRRRRRRRHDRRHRRPRRARRASPAHRHQPRGGPICAVADRIPCS